MNITESFVIELIVQALFYGLYVATLVHCLRWLLFDDEGWSHRKDINWPMLTTAVAIFLFTTASIGMVFQDILVVSIPTLIAKVSARKLQDE